ncbi:GntR family transcriptional regulator [Spongisporangium articulatum]|uniref:GntR family transcriptional regulator n=1 Tax=Spongisporangium articulatum TaxID=3362603 RepID=A0ABW8AKV9_9ACTN
MTIGYRDLAERLRADITAGTYPEGSTLPKQDELAAEHGVNVKTVRQAVALLAAEGLVTPIRRKGTVVRTRPPMRRLGIDRYAKSKWKFGLVAFAADREASGQEWKPGDQTQTVERVPADSEVAEALGVEEGSEVVERARLVRAGGQPTHTLTSYYRPADVEGTPLVNSEPGPAGQGGGFQVLTLRGLEPDRIRETFHSRMPTPDELEALDLPSGEPVVILHRTTFTADGTPVEFARGVHAASRFTWTYEFTIPD